MTVAGLLAVVAAFCVHHLWPRTKPNVILVTFDTTRADRLKSYGYQQGQTEAFDEFAKCGVVFEKAYAPAPITLPSHATMMTGLYPPEHGLRVNGEDRLPNEAPFLPQILKENGFETGAFIAAPAVLGARFGLNRGFDTYDDGFPKQPGRLSHHGEPRRDGKEVVDLALDWLQKRKDQPFFCWIHLYDAHAPYDPRVDVYGQAFVDHPYDGGVAWQIRQFERVISHLEERGLDSNTLVVVAGDHGEGLEEHQEIEHGMLVYNTTMHVPFVFAGVADCKPGTRVASSVSLVDLTPTVLDVLQIPIPEGISGRSLRGALNGEPLSSRDCYGEAETPFILNQWAPLHTVISDRWKYIQSTRPELYDLQKDPGELTNLLNSATEERDRLAILLDDLQHGFAHVTAPQASVSARDLANLKSLGYLSSGKAARGTSDGNPESNLINQHEPLLVDVKDMLPLLAKFETAKHKGLEGELTEAIALLQEIKQTTKQFPAAELLLGDCQAQAGRLADAEITYSDLLEKHPEIVRAHLTLARVLAAQGNPEQAITHYRAFLKTDPASATTHHELARVLMQMGKVEEAVDEYRWAIRISPQLTMAGIDLGQLLMAIQRPAEAVACFEQVLSYESRNAAAHASLSILFAQAGNAASATRHGRLASELLPNSFEVRFNFGILLLSQGLYRQALQELKEAQGLRPDDPRVGAMIQQASEALKTQRE